MQLPRLMPALVSPFGRGGELDLAAHAGNVDRLAEVGIIGFLVAGSTGEGPLLDPGERAELVATLRQRLGKKPHVMVGVWAESVRQALRQADEAAAAGADTVLVVTPTTLARRFVNTQIDHFEAIADRSPLPVLLYSVPANTGYSLDEGAVARLATHHRIIGMKDSGGDAVRIGRIARAGDFVVFNGASASIALAVAGGAFGAITASVNYAPILLSELVTTARRSVAKALPLQDRLTPPAAAIEGHGVPGVKAAARAAGIDGGRPRPPLKALAPKHSERLAAVATAI